MAKFLQRHIDVYKSRFVFIGSASYPKAGTTNLHLDISDATNVIVCILFVYFVSALFDTRCQLWIYILSQFQSVVPFVFLVNIGLEKLLSTPLLWIPLVRLKRIPKCHAKIENKISLYWISFHSKSDAGWKSKRTVSKLLIKSFMF